MASCPLSNGRLGRKEAVVTILTRSCDARSQKHASLVQTNNERLPKQSLALALQMWKRKSIQDFRAQLQRTSDKEICASGTQHHLGDLVECGGGVLARGIAIYDSSQLSRSGFITASLPNNVLKLNMRTLLFRFPTRPDPMGQNSRRHPFP